METIEKYHVGISLKAGDVIVLKNGTRKTIRKIENEHRVIFDDDSKFDLWINEDNIEGVIHMNKPSKQVVETIKLSTLASETKIEKPKFQPLANSYKDLNRILYHGGDSVEFYHLTALVNALSIVKDDCFYSREFGAGHIKYDNNELNVTTNSVLSSNFSGLLKKYARFYLNIKNKTAYSMQKNYEKNNTYGVIIAIDFPMIWKSKTKVILSPMNAHSLSDSSFDWTYYNIAFEKNLKNLNSIYFDFKKTYSACDFNEDNPYLAAEILFYEKILLNKLDYISHIYFKNTREMNNFVGKLSYNEKEALKRKCRVRSELFW